MYIHRSKSATAFQSEGEREAMLTKRLLWLTVVVVLLSLAAVAQTQFGQITGTVKDPSGAVVPNAKITVTNVATGVARPGSTGTAGFFTFPALTPSTYKVVIEAAGFKKAERTVNVNVGSNVDASVSLVVGGGGTVIEVNAETAGVEVNTINQTMSQTVTSQQLLELPTDPYRNPYALVGTAGNVSGDSSSGRGTGYAINGQRSASTSVLLDGAENVDTFTATVGQSVPLDSVQEFSVLTSNFGAEYGRASGGIVNLITKSGTNEWHGSAYEFNRVAALASNTYYNDVNGVPKGEFTRNNFGFSLGGPLIKKKLFFFENLEWIRVRSEGAIAGTIVDPGSYSALNINSQNFFSAYGALKSGITTVSGPFGCGPGINCDVVSFPVPTDAGGGSPQNTWDEVVKLDWNISDKTILTGRYAAFHVAYFPGTVNASPYVGYDTGENDFNQNYTFSLTHIFSPTVVNSLKWVYNRLNDLQGLDGAPVGPTLYTSQLTVFNEGGSPMIFPGYNEYTPGSAIPFGGPQNLYQVYDDFSITRGKHQFKFGGQFIQIRDNRTFGAYEEAVEGLGTSLSTAMTNLVAGNILNFQSAIYPQGKYPCYKNLVTGLAIHNAACQVTLPVGQPSFERNYRYNDVAWYGQDTWKVTPRLTLNAGVRWEYYGVQHNSNPALDSNFVMGPGADIYDQIRNGQTELAANGGYFWKPSYGNFGPRVGFAWDPFGNGKTAIRGGYSIGYERNFGNVTFNAIQNPPNYTVISLTSNVDVPFQMPVYTSNLGPLSGNVGSTYIPAASLRAINQNMHTAYAETWNFGIERQVMKDALFSVQYAGSHGVHLYDIANINVAGWGGMAGPDLVGIGAGGEYLGDGIINGNDPYNRLNMQYSNMNYRSDNGFNKYDALIVSFRANNIHNTGVSINTNYTWSHALDNISSTFSDGAAGDYGLGYMDAFNPKMWYGNSDYDVRQRFVLNTTWALPWGNHSKSGLTRNLIGGWVVSGTLNIHSGYPFTLYDSYSSFYGDPFYAEPAGMLHKGSNTGDTGGDNFNWIPIPTNPADVNTFHDDNDSGVVNLGSSLGMPVCSGLYHVGCTYLTSDMGYGVGHIPDRNQFWGPSAWGLDMSFMKHFKLTERMGLEARCEMYNILNHHNLYMNIYSYDVNSQSYYGTPYAQAWKGGPGSSSDDHRYVQLGLRLTF